MVRKDNSDLPDELLDPKTVVKALWQALLDVRVGRLDAKIGNTIAILSGQILKALETSDLEDRLCDIEDMFHRDEMDVKYDKENPTRMPVCVP